MDAILVVIGILIAVAGALALFELRVRRPDMIVLYESNGQIRTRTGAFYPRHFSLTMKRTTYPIQLTVDAVAVGNLGVRVKLVGAAAPSPANLPALMHVGGWETDAVIQAVEQVKTVLQGLVKEYTERSPISDISSAGVLKHLNGHIEEIAQRFGVDLISLAVQSLDPTDPKISEALSQQEEARLFEQTEQLKHQASVAAARAKFRADEEIAKLEHELELKRAELKKIEFDSEAELARRRITDELERSRLRLAFEKEELEVLMSSPELLMLTPQAARLAEASQNLKNARTVISLTPQDVSAGGSSLITMFRNLLQKDADTSDEA
ncbi:MAG: hypothetical protein IPM16_18465 [Chloroflexi bacterium]|nr:hypothetical protein [Chloroflexota bacterium]